MPRQTLSDDKRKEIATLVRTTRAMTGLTQREFGNLLHVTCTTILNWEKGKTVPPTQRLLAIQEINKNYGG